MAGHKRTLSTNLPQRPTRPWGLTPPSPYPKLGLGNFPSHGGGQQLGLHLGLVVAIQAGHGCPQCAGMVIGDQHLHMVRVGQAGPAALQQFTKALQIETEASSTGVLVARGKVAQKTIIAPTSGQRHQGMGALAHQSQHNPAPAPHLQQLPGPLLILGGEIQGLKLQEVVVAQGLPQVPLLMGRKVRQKGNKQGTVAQQQGGLVIVGWKGN